MQQQPPGCLHEFQFFGHQDDDDHQESIAWLFDHPPPPVREVGDDDRSPAENQPHHRAFDPFGTQYHHPGNGLTFEVDARLGLGSGGAARQTETAAASATIVSTPSREHGKNNLSRITLLASPWDGFLWICLQLLHVLFCS
jgi:hypothetical protein